MFDRFTKQAKNSMNCARQESDRLNHEYLGTEHMLLGLLRVGDGAAIDILKSLGLDSDRIRVEVERVAAPGATRVQAGQLPFTPRSKKVLELAMEEACTLGAPWIGTEHLLLGLIREPDGVAGKVLRNLGVDVARAREKVRAIETPEDGREQRRDLSAVIAREMDPESKRMALEMAVHLLRTLDEEAAAFEVERVVRRLRRS